MLHDYSFLMGSSYVGGSKAMFKSSRSFFSLVHGLLPTASFWLRTEVFEGASLTYSIDCINSPCLKRKSTSYWSFQMRFIWCANISRVKERVNQSESTLREIQLVVVNLSSTNTSSICARACCWEFSWQSVGTKFWMGLRHHQITTNQDGQRYPLCLGESGMVNKNNIDI